MEYYVREKKSKFLGIANIYENAPKTMQGYLTYKSFYTICLSLYSNAQESFVIKMFRFAWGISNGKIDCKVLLTTLQESGFFFHCLKLRGFNKALKLDHENKIKDQDKNMKFAYDTFLGLKQQLNMVKNIGKNMGICEVLNNFSWFENLMNAKGQEPLEIYNAYELVDVFRHLWGMIINLQFVFEEANKKFIADGVDINCLPQATGNFMESLHKLLLNKTVTKIAVRKIQKIWKEKAKKNIQFTATLVKSITLFKRSIKKNN